MKLKGGIGPRSGEKDAGRKNLISTAPGHGDADQANVEVVTRPSLFAEFIARIVSTPVWRTFVPLTSEIPIETVWALNAFG